MAGLLDFLNTPEAQTGLALLAAGGPTPQPMSAGQRIQMALAGAQAQQDAALKRQLLQSQVDENKSQNELRLAQLQRQKRQDDYFLGGVGSSAPMASTSAPAGSPGGEALKAATGVPAGAPAPTQGKFNEWSQKYGIPVDALISDYFSNGGKGIAEMLMKRGTPDMKVQDGYAYDANNVKPGYLPGITTAANGTSVQRIPDPTAPGGVRIAAPLGALDTASAYADMEAKTKGRYTPGAPGIMPGGRKGGQSQLAEIGVEPAPWERGVPASAGGTGGVRGSFVGTPEQILSAIENSNVPPAVKAEMRRAYANQATGNNPAFDPLGSGALPPSAHDAQPAVHGGGLEFSPAEKAQQAAQQAQAVDTAKADVVRDTANKSAGKLQAQSRSAAEIAAQLLDQGPTASGVGAWADKANAFFGVSGKRSDAAQQLEALSGWMVSNVPRMEGPQSDADVRNYQNMAGRVGDRTLPISARKAALQTVMELQQKYADINGTPVPGASAPPSAKLKAPPSMNDLQNTALKYGMTVEQVKQKLGIQ